MDLHACQKCGHHVTEYENALWHFDEGPTHYSDLCQQEGCLCSKPQYSLKAPEAATIMA